MNLELDAEDGQVRDRPREGDHGERRETLPEIHLREAGREQTLRGGGGSARTGIEAAMTANSSQTSSSALMVTDARPFDNRAGQWYKCRTIE